MGECPRLRLVREPAQAHGWVGVCLAWGKGLRQETVKPQGWQTADMEPSDHFHSVTRVTVVGPQKNAVHTHSVSHTNAGGRTPRQPGAGARGREGRSARGPRSLGGWAAQACQPRPLST